MPLFAPLLLLLLLLRIHLVTYYKFKTSNVQFGQPSCTCSESVFKYGVIGYAAIYQECLKVKKNFANYTTLY